MKRTLMLIAVILGFFVSLNAQNTVVDTVAPNDTIKNNISADTNKNQIPAFLVKKGGIVPQKLAKNLILNISRMLFWPEYQDKFVIGVTDGKFEDYLMTVLANRRIHGRKIDVVLVNENTTPDVNIIYLTANKHSLLPKLLKEYQVSSTVIISEIPLDLPSVEIVIKPTFSAQGDKVFSYIVNYKKLLSKKIVPSPEIKAYAFK